MSANIYNGGVIGSSPVFQSGVWGVGDNGITYRPFTPDYISTVLGDNPTGFWLLNETSGSTATDLAGSYNLTYLNSPTLNVAGPGVLNLTAGVTFNGSNQNAKGDNSATYTSESADSWSLECWIKYTSTSTTLAALYLRNTDGGIASTTGGIIVNNNTAGVISAQTINTTDGIMQLNSAGGFNNGVWHHVVATAASGGSFRLYVNGTEVASSATARRVNSTQRSVTVGSNRSGVSSYIQYFPGSIAGVAVYLNTLSAAQVLEHYNVGRL